MAWMACGRLGLVGWDWIIVWIMSALFVFAAVGRDGHWLVGIRMI
jgi:hypothetical protein